MSIAAGPAPNPSRAVWTFRARSDDGRLDIRLQRNNGRYGPILLQKSKVAGRLIFGEITKREAFADSYSVTHISEVACEFNVGR